MKTGEIDLYFTKTGNGSDKYEINREITQIVEFEQRDIRTYIPDRYFDLIFCRNLVFTYFTITYQKKFLRQLRQRIKPGGYLIIGSNETLPPVNWLKRTNKSFPVNATCIKNNL